MTPPPPPGPGRAQRKGRSAEGRAAGAAPGKGGGRTGMRERLRRDGSSATPARTSRVGRYTPPEQSGRYTPPVPRKVRRSPPWYGVLLLVLLVLGVLVILLDYLGVLPGGVSTWYLVAGLVLIFAGFILATRYR